MPNVIEDFDLSLTLTDNSIANSAKDLGLFETLKVKPYLYLDANDESLAKHAEWAEEIKAKYNDINAENIEGIIKAEIGIVFSKVLEDAGVYKRDEKGQAAFVKFIESVK